VKGKKVVLYFYPQGTTRPACTAEACGFRDAFPDYGGTGICDDRDLEGFGRLARQVFKKKHELPFILASDAGLRRLREIRRLGGKKACMERKYMGNRAPARFLIDEGRASCAAPGARSELPGPRRGSAQSSAAPPLAGRPAPPPRSRAASASTAPQAKPSDGLVDQPSVADLVGPRKVMMTLSRANATRDSIESRGERRRCSRTAVRRPRSPRATSP